MVGCFSLDCGAPLKEGKSVYTGKHDVFVLPISQGIFSGFFFLTRSQPSSIPAMLLLLPSQPMMAVYFFSSQASRSAARQIEKSRSPATWSNSFNFFWGETMTNRGTKESCIWISLQCCWVLHTNFFLKNSHYEITAISCMGNERRNLFLLYPKKGKRLCVVLL